MKKYFYLLFIILGIFILNINVKAETYTDGIKAGDYISGPYYYMHVEGSHKLWEEIQEIVRLVDGDRVYCVQPFVRVREDATYEVTTEDINQILELSLEDWLTISRIAYYGWNYKDDVHDHRDDKWYAATQMLIWQYVGPGVDSYFTATIKGERDDTILRSEMDEIMNLVNMHAYRPLFNNSIPTSMIINQSITLTDTRGVLGSYELANVTGGTVVKNGNNLTITPNSIGNMSFSLQKLGNRYTEPIKLYYAIDYQNVIHRGNIDPILLNYNINVTGGDVTINKTDDETYLQVPQGDGSLAGAVYGIYKENGTKISTITTDEFGNAKSNYLPELGRFYLLEEKASAGYEIDKNKYYFEITNSSLHPTIQVFEKVIKRTFEITKVFANAETGIMTPEANIKFGFYNSKNQLVKELITDSQGTLMITLPYGKYKVKQLTTTPGFEKVNDFEIEVNSTGKNIKLIISNAEITARLKVVKVDSETGEIIKKKIKFKIFNQQTGKYVKQTITYPKAETIETFETDENGILITPYPLETGNYYLEEIDQVIDGYLWNKNPIEFSIGDRNIYIDDEDYGVMYEIKFKNTPVKGKIQINKEGENVKYKEDGYEYEFKKLNNIKYGLYASEDIFDSAGNKKYIKDEEITTNTTDDSGKIIFDNLYLGKYYIKELETNSLYNLDKKIYDIELKYKDQYTSVVNYKIDLKNYLKKSDILFNKTDLANGKAIPNTKIEVYTEDDKLVFSGITDSKGQIIIKNLFVGKFYIVEKEASTGYKLSDEKVLFEIKENGEIVKVNMTNEKIKGNLEFTKTSIDLLPLANAKIQIYNEQDELVYENLTNEVGKIIVKDLEYGKYYILEVEAPDGYKLNTERIYFEIINDGETVEVDMMDEELEIEIPITESNIDQRVYSAGIAFIVLGLMATAYVIQNKRKK